MRSLDSIRATLKFANLFRGQVQHIMLAALLGIGAVSILHGTDTKILGLDGRDWAVATIFVAIIHQSLVAIVWRLQLHFGLMVGLFGARALRVWGAIFLPFMAIRPTMTIVAGLADQGTLSGNRNFQLVVGVLLVLVAVWAMHSVIKYFTIPRALGGDHFFDDYLNMPLVDKGAFKVTSNAMYGVVFLGLWGIALLTGSWNALALALFQHAYIWVHMYCTEGPDMKTLYG